MLFFKYLPQVTQPSKMVLFALCICSGSSPPIDIMSPSTVISQLEGRAASYLSRSVRFWKQVQTLKVKFFFFFEKDNSIVDY